jgi:cytochrome b561
MWQTLAAHINHALLYACMVAMPVSGFLGSSFTAYPIKFFGTTLPRLWEASPEMKDICSTIHTSCSYIFMATIAVHVLAVLWHAVRRDGIAKRMQP